MKVAQAHVTADCLLVRKPRAHHWILAGVTALLIHTFSGASAALGQGGGGAYASLKVRVTDSTAETPVERVRVELMKFPDGIVQQAFSDSSGWVEFLSLAAQTYVVRGTKAGYSIGEAQVDIRRGEFSKSINLQLQVIQSDRKESADGSVSVRNLSMPEGAFKEFQQGVRSLNTEKNPRQSVVHLQRAIEIFPDYFEAHFLLGMAYIQLGLKPEAESELLKAIKLNPKSLSPYYPLSLLLFSQERYTEEELLLLQAMKMDNEGWQWPFELARCYAGEGMWDKALRYGKMAQERPKAPSKTHLLMADLYSNTKATKAAVQELEEFVRLDPESPYTSRARQALNRLRIQRQE